MRGMDHDGHSVTFFSKNKNNGEMGGRGMGEDSSLYTYIQHVYETEKGQVRIYILSAEKGSGGARAQKVKPKHVHLPKNCSRKRLARDNQLKQSDNHSNLLSSFVYVCSVHTPYTLKQIRFDSIQSDSIRFDFDIHEVK